MREDTYSFAVATSYATLGLKSVQSGLIETEAKVKHR